MGIGPVPATRARARPGRPDARRDRRVRAERAVRRPGADVVPRARRRSGGPAPQPVRRRDRVRPPARRDRRPPRRAARVRVPRAAGRALRPDRALHRPRHGRRRRVGDAPVPDTVFHLRRVETPRRPARARHDRQRRGLDEAAVARPLRARVGTASCSASSRSGDWAAAVFTGKPFWFCAGADIDEFPNVTPETAAEGSRAGHELFERIRTLPFPTVAAINGACLGGGLELALHCTARTVASTVRHFGFPEVFLGLFPAWAGTQLTPRLIGPQAAVALIVAEPAAPEPAPACEGRARARPRRPRARTGRVPRRVDRVRRRARRAPAIERAEPDWSELETIMRRARNDVDDAVHGATPAPYRALDLIEGAATWTRRGGAPRRGGGDRRAAAGKPGAGVDLRLRPRRAPREEATRARRRAAARAEGRHRRRRADGEPARRALPPPARGADRPPRPRPGDRRPRARGRCAASSRAPPHADG